MKLCGMKEYGYVRWRKEVAGTLGQHNDKLYGEDETKASMGHIHRQEGLRVE